jgi:outer membrane biosynthesis protein TonB
MRTVVLLTLLSAYFFAQSPSVTESGTANRGHIRCTPAYPRAAKDQRKMGKTITRIKVSPDGSVPEGKTVSANAVFEKYMLEGLKHWRF